MADTTTNPAWSTQTKFLIIAILAVLAAATYFIGTTGLLAVDGTLPFRPVAFTIIIPVALFFSAYALSSRLRDFVLSWDIRILAMLMQWRVLGFSFLVLYAHNVLPAGFAWPAGLGDVLIGIAAPFIVLQLARDPAFATSRRFVTYHLLGLLDFAVAVTAATLTSGAYPGIYDSTLTSGAMEVWPLNLFPGFIVPMFIIVHIVVLLKVRELRRIDRQRLDSDLQPRPAIQSAV